MDKKIQEQSIWTVYINSQLLFKKTVDGRTILLGMTAEENKKVAEIMSQTIDNIAKALEKRTTQHEVPVKTDDNETKDTEAPKDLTAKSPPSDQRPKITRGASGRFVSKKAKEPEVEEESIEKGDRWDSIFKKLKS